MRPRWTPAALALLLAGCGGASQPAATGMPGIEQAVKHVLERTMMTSQPRTEQGSSWSTHVRHVSCATKSGNAFSCEVTLGNGSRRRVIAHERSDGEVVVG